MSEQDEAQIERLAAWLMENTDEPKESYGAVDAAIHAMTQQQQRIRELGQQFAGSEECRLAGEQKLSTTQQQLAARDAVIAEALARLDAPSVFARVDGAREVLTAAPESVLAERDAEKWEEGVMSARELSEAERAEVERFGIHEPEQAASDAAS